MMERRRIQPDKIVIREFRLVKAQIDSPFDFRISNIASFDFSVDFNAGINLEESLIKADFFVDIRTVSAESTKEATCNSHFAFLYYVDGLAEHAQLQADGTTDWNPYLANAIVSVTYSTSRGVLLSHLQGTVLKDFMLPVIDPNALLNDKISQVIRRGS